MRLPTDRSWLRPAAAFAAVVACLWPLPVVGLLHAESSAVVAAAAFFVSAVAGVGALRRGEGVGRVALRSVALLAAPLAGLTLSLLWRANCAYWTGLGLFALLVPPSALLGVGVADALVAFDVRRARLAAVGIGLAVAACGTLWALGFHPQLFVYNLVYGGVLGPIYDEELTVRAGLFVARGEALLWAGVLVAAARWRRGGGTRPAVAACVVLGLLAVGLVVSDRLGTTQSAAGIERVLNVTAGDARIVVHLSPETPEATRADLADTARFRLAQIESKLGVRAAETVHVYLYPDAETKGALLGSRETSVVPVWLARPQVHMLASEVDRSLGHELAHVVAREFGMPGLRASPTVGLVEGLAVAVEPPDGLPAPEALVAAALALPGDAGGLDVDPAAVVRASMSPLGFWGGRAAVSYTATGAFVGWLIETEGVADVRRAYRTGDVGAATGVPLDTLTQRWAASVRATPPTREAAETAAWLFRQPSLFEVRCPHHVPAYVRATRAGFDALEAGDAARAETTFADALAAEPDFAPAQSGQIAAVGAGGRAPTSEIVRQLARAVRDTTASATTLRAASDAMRLLGNDALALRLLTRASNRLAPTDHAGRLSLAGRAMLTAPDLRVLLGSSADPARAAARLDVRAPLFAALLWDGLGEPVRALHAVRRAVVIGNDAALDLLAARLAVRAGSFREADVRAARAESSFRARGAFAAAAVAGDVRARARWSAANRDRPSRVRDPHLSPSE